MAIKQETRTNAGLSLADPALLEKIDKLFACNVGEYINLPQLVVVGDQSSGKSSVLEGLTKLKFPRSAGLCTRFATQIIFRRDPTLTERTIRGSIIFASGTDNDDHTNWSITDIQTLDEAQFEAMMREVHARMGLSQSEGDNLPTFSANILRLEIHGPEESHLSVIDVPGIFKTTTPGVTTKSDIALVRDMVLQYMRNPRSIMLTVVPANVDIATQEIIEIARELDPEGIRTLRIITKPDLVDKGAEDKIIDLVEGKHDSHELGWVVVRNLGQKDLNDAAKNRDFEEESFRHSPPWNRLSKENYGIGALKVRLQVLLASNVKREFPSVRSEVSKRLKECKTALGDMGAERGSAGQQSKYLLDIISKFQRVTEDALHTNYGRLSVFDEEPDLRLATLVANRNTKFSEEFAEHGHVYSFTSHDHESDSELQSTFVMNPGKGPLGTEQNEVSDSIKSRETKARSDIEDILEEPVEIRYSIKYGILDWIEHLYRESRGFEIGTFSASLLSSVLKKQTDKWPAFAKGYICDIISMVHIFTRKALMISSGDERVSHKILSFLMDDLIAKYEQALSVTDFLLRIEREGTPMTLNHYLNSNLQKCRQERINFAVKENSFSDCSHGEVVRVSDLTQFHHMSNTKHTVQDIHDILKSYYKVARKRFIDNVCMQAADYYLVTRPAAPMELLSPSWVYTLSSEQLEEIAGEEDFVRRKRRQLEKQVKELEAGKRILL